jgi:ABC-type amino acid transport substrate-binding protein
VKSYQTIDLALADLRNGNIVAVINDEPQAQVVIGMSPGLKIVGPRLSSEQFGIAVKKDNARLLQSINKALRAVTDSGDLDRLKAKWFPVADS